MENTVGYCVVHVCLWKDENKLERAEVKGVNNASEYYVMSEYYVSWSR